MNSKFTILYAWVMLVMLMACDTEEKVAPGPIGVDKTVTFKVFAHKDYTSSYNANYQATIRLFIKRGVKGAIAEKVVFDSTFTRTLKELPVAPNGFVIKKKVQGLSTDEEWLLAGTGYSVGQEVHATNELIPDDKQELTVEVAL